MSPSVYAKAAEATLASLATPPALDEVLPPILVGRRAATPAEAKAINALNTVLGAMLDDQPAPPKTLFDYSGLAPADAPRLRPALSRLRARALTRDMARDTARDWLEPRLLPLLHVSPKEVTPQPYNDELNGEDYTPAFVAPEVERMPSQAQAQPHNLAASLPEAATTRDEALAVAREVQARAGAAIADYKADNVTVQQAAAETMVSDAMPFGAATLRLFCC